MKLVIDFEKLAYKKPRSSFKIFMDFFQYPIISMLGTTPKLPPFVYKRTSENRFSGPASDQELGKTICFDDEQANQILIKHIPRLRAHESLLSTLYYLSVALIVLTGFYIISLARPIFNAGVAFDIVSNLMLIVLSSICFFICP